MAAFQVITYGRIWVFTEDAGKVLLLTGLRHLGYGFNPLSLWYCEHADGRPRAVIAEVNNTFGEHHFYLLANAGEPLDWPVRDVATKCFYVSPLMKVAVAMKPRPSSLSHTTRIGKMVCSSRPFTSPVRPSSR